MIVVGCHRVVEASELSASNLDRISLEAVCGASVHCGVEEVALSINCNQPTSTTARNTHQNC
jgi:hypothetical protein